MSKTIFKFVLFNLFCKLSFKSIQPYCGAWYIYFGHLGPLIYFRYVLQFILGWMFLDSWKKVGLLVRRRHYCTTYIYICYIESYAYRCCQWIWTTTNYMKMGVLWDIETYLKSDPMLLTSNVLNEGLWGGSHST